VVADDMKNGGGLSESSLSHELRQANNSDEEDLAEG